MTDSMTSKLKEICNKKRDHVEAQKSQVPLNEIKAMLKESEAPRGFLNALQNKAPHAIIAEIKKASPSKGIIRADFNPAEIAKDYELAGAACLSILTDTPYFQGHDNFLKQAKAASTLPTLRKDFIIDEYQIDESRALGADCILLIMAALTDAQAAQFHTHATELGMDVLVEIHDAQELERATPLNPKMIGVNNRNLRTLEVNLQTSHDLIKNIPNDVFKIAESGLKTPGDIKSLQNTGYQGFLIGESLMTQKNIQNALKTLLTQITN